MKQCYFISLMFAICALVGCRNGGENGDNHKSVFSIDRSVVDISAEGGYVEVGYTLRGGNSAVMPIAKCDAEWSSTIAGRVVLHSVLR